MTKKLLKRGVSLLGTLALSVSLVSGAFAEEAKLEQPVLNPRVKNIINADGYQFIDLNDNGALDAYEDWRLNADTRDATWSVLTFRSYIYTYFKIHIRFACYDRAAPMEKKSRRPENAGGCSGFSKAGSA